MSIVSVGLIILSIISADSLSQCLISLCSLFFKTVTIFLGKKKIPEKTLRSGLRLYFYREDLHLLLLIALRYFLPETTLN